MRLHSRYVATLFVASVAAACGSSGSEGGASAGDAAIAGDTAIAGDGSVGLSEASPPTACPNGTTTMALTAAADTSLTDFCTGTICYGNVDFVQVGRTTADAPPDVNGLVRFAVDAANRSKISATTLVGGSLVVHGRPNCSQCGRGIPARAGTLRAYPARSDWEETNPDAAACGVDRCHRTGGSNARGWGGDIPAGSSTRIAKGVDYLEPASEQAFADGATTVEV